MKTIKTVMTQLTDPTNLLRDVKDTLRTLDLEYPEEEQLFFQAATALEQEVGSGAKEYLAALEQEIASGIIFAGWQGFKLNLECFTNPVNKLRLQEDFEELYLEQRMFALPVTQKARQTINNFLAFLPQDKRYLTTGINDYYAYLQTTAYKLAHYFGFRLADHFLQYVIPGYISDPLLTDQYTWELNTFFKTDVSRVADSPDRNPRFSHSF